MDQIERICPHCGAANPLTAYYCGACATSLRPVTGTALVRHQAPAPLAVRRRREAVTALAVGLAALAGRAVVAMARNPELVQGALSALTRKEEKLAPLAQPPSAAVSPKRTVIRRRWVVQDVFGVRSWGSEEIEIEHPESENR